MRVDDIIRILNLEKHPREGGYYAETYRSRQNIMNEKGRRDNRSLATAIYYLLTPDFYSEMHRLESDEIFHFYLGDPVEMLQLFPRGGGKIIKIGNDVTQGFLPQVLIPKNVWQGCRVIHGGRFALLGTTMSPGFDYSEYESGIKKELIKKYPEFEDIITDLTRL
ncbi:MAG: cupin domain-containing protein [Candidatus Omnitrophica bacterium]|nr:cupin domain-containing protein [Candidatus Omnitrophota bacterium]MCK4835998.1 cupin domain-containing protein [Candidatus Aminicenantes bacterium]